MTGILSYRTSSIAEGGHDACPKAASDLSGSKARRYRHRRSYILDRGQLAQFLVFKNRPPMMLDQHRLWNQPWCCVCGSAVTRPDDPWEVCQMSTRSGADWMHKSCMEKFESWADDEARRPDREPGWQLIPNMEVLDSAWRKKLTKCTK
jgi:hypothetical protein